jgi:uncharacterized protein (DUF58 family)
VNGSPAVPADVLRQVRRLELRTRRLVDSRFAGDYRSLFKGQGMEFAEVREYQPGDEVRAIDWHVSARMGRPFVKRYVEERELTVMLALDVSGSSRFGTGACFKGELVTELATVLALAAVRNNDRVGLLCFTDRVEHALPPRKGRRHALRLVRDLLVVPPSGTRTAFAVPLERLGRLLPHRAVVFVCSDFLGDDYERPLSRLAQRHDVIAVTVHDPAERTLPDVGLARFRDPETGELVELDTGDPALRDWFAAQVAAEDAARRAVFTRLGIDEVAVGTDTGYAGPLLAFFQARARRAHGAVRTAATAAGRGGARLPAPSGGRPA